MSNIYSETSFCLLNGKPTELKIFDIFDFRKFDTFYGVTYSASRKFILKYLFNYRSLDLIVGIPKDAMQKEIHDTFEDMNNFYKVHYKKPTVAGFKGFPEAVKNPTIIAPNPNDW